MEGKDDVKDQKDEQKVDEIVDEKEGSKGAEYDEEWDRLDAEEKGEQKPEPKQTDKQIEEPAAGEGDKILPETKEEPKPDDKKDQSKAALSGVDKALHDTKKWATELVEENKKLKQAIAEKESAEKSAKVEAAEKAQKAAQEKLNGSLEEAYKEYPELKGVLDEMKSQLDATQKEINDIRTADAKKKEASEKLQADRDFFEQNIKPEIVKTHKDFDAIVNSPDHQFFKWAEKQSPAIKFAVFNSNSPADMVMALDAFKKDKSSGYLKEKKETDTKLKDSKLESAQSLKGGVTIPENIEPGTGPSSKDNYDAGWEAADKLLKDQGVT